MDATPPDSLQNKQASATKLKTLLENYFRSVVPLACDVTLYVGFIYGLPSAISEEP